jgi:hypothetical protein
MHPGLCPASFIAQENHIGVLGQFMPDPGAVIAILADVQGTQESTPALRVPATLAGMAATANFAKAARWFGVSVRQIRSAVESVKQAGMPRGGPVRNPNVVIDEEGEVYPIGPGGGGPKIRSEIYSNISKAKIGRRNGRRMGLALA